MSIQELNLFTQEELPCVLPKRTMEWTNIHMVGDNDNVRYVLRKEGDNPLVVMGVNPSTANEDNPDATMRKVMGFAEYNGFDSFIMVNLYPQRTKDPNELHEVDNVSLRWKNKKAIHDALKNIEHPTILAAWGNLIEKRYYLPLCLNNIENELMPLDIRWKCIKTSKAGNPVHPLYQKYCKLQDFDMIHYDLDLFCKKDLRNG